MARRLKLIKHHNRPDVSRAAAIIARDCERFGIELDDDNPDLVLVLGGDGTLLNAARYAREHNLPLLGINFGHMGFLADTSGEPLVSVVKRISCDDYAIDTRMTLDVSVYHVDGTSTKSWALNEAAVLHTDMARPVEMVFAVDGQNVSTYGADGIILATPTGSTAYSFSAGGPVVWPDTEAIVMAPLAAHGLFTRPLVVGPESVLEIGILERNRQSAEAWMDGIDCIDAEPGALVRVSKGAVPVKIARLEDRPFSERLVNKFSLPVTGWRSSQRFVEEPHD